MTPSELPEPLSIASLKNDLRDVRPASDQPGYAEWPTRPLESRRPFNRWLHHRDRACWTRKEKDENAATAALQEMIELLVRACLPIDRKAQQASSIIKAFFEVLEQSPRKLSGAEKETIAVRIAQKLQISAIVFQEILAGTRTNLKEAIAGRAVAEAGLEKADEATENMRSELAELKTLVEKHVKAVEGHEASSEANSAQTVAAQNEIIANRGDTIAAQADRIAALERELAEARAILEANATLESDMMEDLADRAEEIAASPNPEDSD